jgi:hypothetical protein
VGEGLVGVLIGAAVTLLAGLLTHEREKSKRESEEARWYGQLFLQRRFDALSKLYSVFVSCRLSLGGSEIVAQKDSLEKIIEEPRAGVKLYEATLRQRQLELHRAFTEASIYLDRADNKAIGNGVAEYSKVANSVIARIGKFLAEAEAGKGGQLPWLTFEEGERSHELFKAPIECLKRLLTPRLPQGLKSTDTDTGTDT